MSAASRVVLVFVLTGALGAASCTARGAAGGPSAPPRTDAPRAFPGAEGWAAFTPGGRGGRILRVTTLEASGPGSFLEALNAPGPRTIVFEVGGVIDLGKRTIRVTEPYLTIAGQTAPSPGITFVRGGFSVVTHDVVVRHIRVRPGSGGRPPGDGTKWDVDGMSTWGRARDGIVDHCSFSWASDENLSAAGPGFEGATPAEWRENTARRITYSNNIIAEAIQNPTPEKLKHGKGTLILDNVGEVLILGNLYASNPSRNPLFKGGVRGAVVNNFIYNPATSAVDYHLPAFLFKEHVDVRGRMELVGNVMRHGPNTRKTLPLLIVAGDGDLELHARDNLAWNRAGAPVAIVAADSAFQRRIIEMPAGFFWPAGLRPIPAAAVEEKILEGAGARPWDRDEVDLRIVRSVRDGTGRTVNSEADVGGYPVARASRRAFEPAEWDLSTMTPR